MSEQEKGMKKKKKRKGSKSPKRRKKKGMVNGVAMYDTDAAAFDNSVERNGGNLRWRNALTFKSLELPHSARKPDGSADIWTPKITFE
jgi:hypothetical protein